MITLILMLLFLHRTVLYSTTALYFAMSLFPYACMHACFSYAYSTRIHRMYAAVHTTKLLFMYLLVAQCRMHPRCDSVYEPSAAKMFRTSILENVQYKQNMYKITQKSKKFYFRKNNQQATAQSVNVYS